MHKRPPKLSGYHTLANNSLLNDIEKLYRNRQVTIPQYLLVDDSGKYYQQSYQGLGFQKPNPSDR